MREARRGMADPRRGARGSPTAAGICASCARRAWLLGRLSVRLDFRARDLGRLWRLLELPDEQLIEAIGGHRRAELRADYAAWHAEAPDAGETLDGVCRHHDAFPRRLRPHALAPRALHVRGELALLGGLSHEKVVAIVGARRATDYGMETARSLARSLGGCGLVVASALDEGIAAAALAGALEAQGRALAVMPGTLRRCSPAWCESIYRRVVLERGCAICESAPSARRSSWGRVGAQRTLALLADLVVVVEAEERPAELACAHVARAHGIPVAAVPGRVTSPASRGAHTLLAEGARFVRGPQDALDALYDAGSIDSGRLADARDRAGGDARRPEPGYGRSSGRAPTQPLERRLACVLERVGLGEDTLAKLAAGDGDSGELACALSELELRGLLRRGDGGRYLPAGTGHKVRARCAATHRERATG